MSITYKNEGEKMSKKIRSYDEAVVLKIIDGDTVDLMVNLGFNTWSKSRIRLYGINAPEIKGEEKPLGLKSKEFLSTLIKVGDTINITTHGIDKYGRCLATLFIGKLNINDYMIEKGYAVEYMK